LFTTTSNTISSVAFGVDFYDARRTVAFRGRVMISFLRYMDQCSRFVVDVCDFCSAAPLRYAAPSGGDPDEGAAA
jgi:hypothetical protein